MISIVIPNYNGIQHLETCFDSIFKQSYKNLNVILVDNGSNDDSVYYTNHNFPEVHIIKLNYNSGFSMAVNKGIKFALDNNNCSYILLLNNDIECTPNFLKELLKGFQSSEIGSVACKMLNFYNRDIIDDAGDFIKKNGSPFVRGYEQKDVGQYDKPEFIFGACAGAALYKREIFDNVGYFDEDFFAYYEDIDFDFRMQLSGYKCFYNPKAVCFHKRGATSKYNAGFQAMLCEKNLIALRIKNYPLREYIISFPFFFIARLRRYLLLLLRNGFKVFFYAFKGYFKGLIQVPKSIRKRKLIQANVKVSKEYAESLFSKKYYLI